MKKYKKLVLELERELERLQRSQGQSRERELEEKLQERERELRELRRRRTGIGGSGEGEALREAQLRNAELEEQVDQLNEDIENAKGLLEENMDEIERLKDLLQRRGGEDGEGSARITQLEQRLEEWERSLIELREENADVKKLEDRYPGILTGQGCFLIQLEIAKSAISLNRKLLVVQAVEHAQSQFEANALTNLIDQLRRDEDEMNRLEARIQKLFRDISELELVPEKRSLKKIGYSQSDLKEFANQTLKLKSLADVPFQELPTDEMVIEIEQHGDGSLVVFTPLTTQLSESELS